MAQVYSVRKRLGQWAVCSDENVVLRFETYDEAVSTARDAGEMLANQPSRGATKPTVPRVLGVAIPSNLLARANRVIEYFGAMSESGTFCRASCADPCPISRQPGVRADVRHKPYEMCRRQGRASCENGDPEFLARTGSPRQNGDDAGRPRAFMRLRLWPGPRRRQARPGSPYRRGWCTCRAGNPCRP